MSELIPHLTPQNFRLRHRLRVRWGEVDIQRIVFNPHYLMYIDGAFTEYWRALGIPYESIPSALGGDLFVKKSTLEYHGSARLDDLLDVCLKCERIGNSSMVFQSGIFRGDTLLVSADVVYVFANPLTQRPTPVPPVLRELLASYEAGASPVEMRVGSWIDIGAALSSLRQSVFSTELNIDLGLLPDALDLEGVHALVVNRMGEAVATGRLTQEGPGLARIARVAVDRALRASGFGSAVVHALMQHAAESGNTRVVLSSQSSAQGFYSRLGFSTTSEPYVEARVQHIDMTRSLKQRAAAEKV